MNEIGKKIEERIQELNMSQKELSEKVGVTEATISRYIKGDRIPRGDIIPKIALALNISADSLVGNSCDEDNNLNTLFTELLFEEYKKKNIDLNDLPIEKQRKLAKQIANIILTLNDE